MADFSNVITEVHHKCTEETICINCKLHYDLSLVALMVAHLKDDCIRKHHICCVDSFTIAVGTSSHLSIFKSSFWAMCLAVWLIYHLVTRSAAYKALSFIVYVYFDVAVYTVIVLLASRWTRNCGTVTVALHLIKLMKIQACNILFIMSVPMFLYEISVWISLVGQWRVIIFFLFFFSLTVKSFHFFLYSFLF